MTKALAKVGSRGYILLLLLYSTLYNRPTAFAHCINIYIYTYTYTYTYIYICICIYIYRISDSDQGRRGAGAVAGQYCKRFKNDPE